MTKIFTYKTILIKGPNKWIYAEFPFDSIKEFGTRRTIRVKVKFEGQPFEMSLLPNGKGGHWLHVRKEIRTAVGKDEGDSISIELEKDKRIVAIKNVTVNEPFFPGHFPENPIMPGVLQIEALAQAGGLLMSQSVESIEDKNSLFMSIDKCRFRKMVRPGDVLSLELEVIRFKGSICKLQGKCLVDGEVVSEAEIMLALMDK